MHATERKLETLEGKVERVQNVVGAKTDIHSLQMVQFLVAKLPSARCAEALRRIAHTDLDQELIADKGVTQLLSTTNLAYHKGSKICGKCPQQHRRIPSCEGSVFLTSFCPVHVETMHLELSWMVPAVPEAGVAVVYHACSAVHNQCDSQIGSRSVNASRGRCKAAAPTRRELRRQADTRRSGDVTSFLNVPIVLCELLVHFEASF